MVTEKSLHESFLWNILKIQKFQKCICCAGLVNEDDLLKTKIDNDPDYILKIIRRNPNFYLNRYFMSILQ